MHVGLFHMCCMFYVYVLLTYSTYVHPYTDTYVCGMSSSVANCSVTDRDLCGQNLLLFMIATCSAQDISISILCCSCDIRTISMCSILYVGFFWCFL